MKHIITLLLLTASLFIVNGQEVLFTGNVEIGSKFRFLSGDLSKEYNENFSSGDLNYKPSNTVLNPFYNTGSVEKKLTLPIINSVTNSLALILLDKNNINVFSFDKDLKIDNLFSIGRPKAKFRNLIGHSIDGDTYHIYLKSEKKFFNSQFSLETGEVSNNPIELKLKNEKYLLGFSSENNFYFLTLIKRTSKLKLYTLNGYDNVVSKEFDFTKYRFTKYDPYTIASIFTYSESPIEMVDNSSPSPLDVTAKDKKAYVIDNTFYLSFDNLEGSSYFISIDLENMESSMKIYPHANAPMGINYKTNSYVYDKKLYQVKSSKDELYITMKDFYTTKLLKEFKAMKNEEITFKNTALKQEGGKNIFTENKEKELKKSGEFFRKLSSSNVGISVYKSDALQITFGGYKEFTRSNSMGGFGAMPMGGVAPIFNPTFHSFSSYTTSRSMYFTGLFDSSTFEHIEGDIPQNAFDKIKLFSKDIKSRMSTKTIFKIDDYYILGYYDKVFKKYFLRKFEDG